MKIPFQQLDFRWEDSGFYNSTIGRLFFLGSRRHLSLPHTDLVLPTGNTKLHLIVPKGDVHQPPSLIEQRTSNHFQLGPSKCMVPHGSSKTDSGISGCCIYLERGDFSKGMGQVAVFPSYAIQKEWQPCAHWDSYVHFCFLQEKQGWERDKPWKETSPAEVTLSGFCVFMLFS